MIKALIGRKLGMTAVFDGSGNRIPVTLLEIGPCTVIKVKKSEGGRGTAQLGYQSVRPDRLNKPMKGMFQKAGLSEGYRVLREFPFENAEGLEVGAKLTAEQLFKENTLVKVIGTSKGCGFAGAMKRHNFNGAVMSHGASKVHRKPMSAGATDAARVFKGKRSPGHMGDVRVTVKNLDIVRIKPVEGELGEGEQASGKYVVAVRGAVPGKPKSLVIIENI